MFSFWTSLDHLSLYIYIPKRYPIPIYGALIGTRTTTWRLSSPQRDFEEILSLLTSVYTSATLESQCLVESWLINELSLDIKEFTNSRIIGGKCLLLIHYRNHNMFIKLSDCIFALGPFNYICLLFISLSHLHMAKYKHMIYSRNNNK